MQGRGLGAVIKGRIPGCLIQKSVLFSSVSATKGYRRVDISSYVKERVGGERDFSNFLHHIVVPFSPLSSSIHVAGSSDFLRVFPGMLVGFWVSFSCIGTGSSITKLSFLLSSYRL